MNILKEIWDGKSGKYVSGESIQRCWRKADILPPTWNADINSNVGSASLPKHAKVVSKEVCNELCKLMASIKLKATQHAIDTTEGAAGAIFQDSSVGKKRLPRKDMLGMAETWINFEDNPTVRDVLVDDELDAMEMHDEEQYDSNDDKAPTEPLVEVTRASKYTHMEVSQSLEVVQDWITSRNSTNSESSSLLDRLKLSVQRDYINANKKEPRITNYFKPLCRK